MNAEQEERMRIVEDKLEELYRTKEIMKIKYDECSDIYTKAYQLLDKIEDDIKEVERDLLDVISSIARDDRVANEERCRLTFKEP